MTMAYNQRAWKNRISNAQGKGFEAEIDRACVHYQQKKLAAIEKTPEPFIVIKKQKGGNFTGKFTNKKAQPDYKGTLPGGQTIVFEAKSTLEDRIQQSAVTPTQAEILENYYHMGAIAFVCISIQNQFFAIPWHVWRDMKAIYGRKYVKPEEIQRYKVRYSMGVMFLERVAEGGFCRDQ